MELILGSSREGGGAKKKRAWGGRKGERGGGKGFHVMQGCAFAEESPLGGWFV